MRKPAFCICENKGGDQLHPAANPRLRFYFIESDSKIHLRPESQIFQASSLVLWLDSPVCIGPGWKPQAQVFSRRGSCDTERTSLLYICLFDYSYTVND